jgi:glycosyltransferase involved in cell wall biosynthesis
LTRDVRAVRAAHAAQGRGYDVVAVSGQISGESAVALDGIEIVRVGRPARINRLWLGGSAEPRSKGRLLRELRALARVARLLTRSARIALVARRLPPTSVVHAHDLDTLPAGLFIARRNGARLVYDAHELYSEFEAPPPRLARALILLLEGALARRADSVVTVSDGVARELKSRLRLRRDPLVVLNAPRRAEIEWSPRSDGPLRVVYQGGLGPGRRLEDLLDAATAEGIELTIRIRMADPDELRAAIAARGLRDRVRVEDPVPPAQVLEALSGFDVGLIFDRPRTRNSALSTPNKLFEYLMAGLAVVAPYLETLGPLVVGEGVGATYDPDQPDALRPTLEALARDPEGVDEMRHRARELAMRRLNAEAAAETLAKAWEGTP